MPDSNPLLKNSLRAAVSANSAASSIANATMHLQTTLEHIVRRQGVGLHSGQTATISLRPAGADTGIVFRRIDLVKGASSAPVIPARHEYLIDTQLGSTLGNAEGARVATVEHLMAALWAEGIDNVMIDIDGPEVPIMDGSARPFIDMLREAGRKPLNRQRRIMRIVEPVSVREGAKLAELRPFDGFHVSFEIDFKAQAIGYQHLSLNLDGAEFARDVASARTFGLLEEVDALRAAGLAQGGSLGNSVVVSGADVLNPEGLRSADEFVRHKMLDAVGDLYLCGFSICGAYRGRYAGHGLNARLLEALFAQKDAYVIETLSSGRQYPVWGQARITA